MARLNGPDCVLSSSRGVAVYPPGASFGPRAMRDYEFVWMIEGDAEYRRDSTTISAPVDSIVLCRPGATDYFRWDPRRRTRHAFYHFSIRALPREWPPEAEWPLVRVPQEGDVLRPLFRHLLTWAGKGSELLCRLTMAHMLSAFVLGEISATDAPRRHLPEPVERALAFIQARLEEDPSARIGLEPLARAACVTPEHLCRLFKAATGRAPVETVRSARLERAAVLLARSNYGVREVADLCGFASAFHFSRRFKEAFGKSPREARKELQAGRGPLAHRLVFMAPSLVKTASETSGYRPGASRR